MSPELTTFCTIIGAVSGIVGLYGVFCKERKEPSVFAIIIGVVILVAIYLPKGGTGGPGPYSTPIITTAPTAVSPTAAPETAIPKSTPTLNTYTFSSSPLQFPETLNKYVYTGPGDNYVRAANGKAQFISSEFKYGGRDGDWLFVRCTVKNGMRYGYIYVGEYSQTIQTIPSLQFSNASAVITRSTGIWDSLMDYNIGAVDNLYEGQNVTYLCNFNIDGKKLAYVEASTASGSVRGFVDPSCITFN